MISHENILKFLGQSERRDNLSSLGSEYWLATEYHPKGSLYDYLKANLVSWENLCKIALSIGEKSFLEDLSITNLIPIQIDSHLVALTSLKGSEII